MLYSPLNSKRTPFIYPSFRVTRDSVVLITRLTFYNVTFHDTNLALKNFQKCTTSPFQTKLSISFFLDAFRREMCGKTILCANLYNINGNHSPLLHINYQSFKLISTISLERKKYYNARFFLFKVSQSLKRKEKKDSRERGITRCLFFHPSLEGS